MLICAEDTPILKTKAGPHDDHQNYACPEAFIYYLSINIAILQYNPESL